MPSAIVTGATGIIGRAIVKQLAKDPSRWQTIYAISRSQTEEYPSNVKHSKIDLTAEPTELAKQLQGVEAEYVFFTAYLQRATDDEEWTVNGALLRNFLEALALTGAEKKLKRVILPNGGKQYGLHLGPTKNPSEEDDPRIDGPGRPPNFYYRQQDILREMSDGKDWDWVVTIPNSIIGFARGNFMNISTALALYASITRELDEDCVFPGSEQFYLGYETFTYSNLHGAFSEWAALEPRCGNEIFNVANGDIQSWQNLWPKLAKRFGGRIPSDQFTRPAPLSSRFEFGTRPPLDDYAASVGLVGKVKGGVVEQRVDLVQWAARPEVKSAWEKLATRDGLEKDALEKATWMFAGFTLGRNYDCVMNMSKARKFGWTGYIDSWDAFAETFDELEKEKIIPKTRV